MPHTCTEVHACAPTHPCMLHSAVLILVTAEGLTTRDSTGSNQRKPDFFFSPQRNRLPLVSNSAFRVGLWGEIFVSKKEMWITISQHDGFAHFHGVYDKASNSKSVQITTSTGV